MENAENHYHHATAVKSLESLDRMEGSPVDRYNRLFIFARRLLLKCKVMQAEIDALRRERFQQALERELSIVHPSNKA